MFGYFNRLRQELRIAKRPTINATCFRYARMAFSRFQESAAVNLRPPQSLIDAAAIVLIGLVCTISDVNQARAAVDLITVLEHAQDSRDQGLGGLVRAQREGDREGDDEGVLAIARGGDVVGARRGP